MKKRIISAIIMLLIAIPLLIIGKLPFKIFVCALSIMAMYEWLKAYKIEHAIPKILEILSYIIVAFLSYTLSNYQIKEKLVGLLIIILLLYSLPIVFTKNKDKYNIETFSYMFLGTILLGIAFSSFITIRNNGLIDILYLALITITTDTFALVGGSLIGEHKLCKKISPNKTIEGFITGMLLGTVIPSMYYLFIIDKKISLLVLVPITLLLSCIGQFGDLFFSSIKRKYQIKDFSNLIPGHGGILDRLDSLIFVVITYSLLSGLL